jgi:hypothetical protein
MKTKNPGAALALADEQPDVGPAWDSDEAYELFTAVRKMCGVMVGADFDVNVATALQEAREILDREDRMGEPIEAEIEIKINHLDNRAAGATIEALMMALRERGTTALEERDTRHRLGELTEDQLVEVGDRLQQLKAGFWRPDEVKHLLRMCR